MTPENIQRMRDVAMKATQGEWRCFGGATPHYRGISVGDRIIIERFADQMERENAPPMDEQVANSRHIAEFQPANVLPLLAELTRLRAELEAAKEIVGKLRGSVLVLLDHVDWKQGNCGMTEPVSAVLPLEIINITRKALAQSARDQAGQENEKGTV